MTAERTEEIFMETFLPLRDILLYLLLVVGDGLILAFWWFVMSRLGDR